MPKTNVTFLLDRSGSMEQIKDDTIGAFNAYLDGLKKSDQIIFSLVQFDSQGLEKLYVREPIDKVAPLTKDTFVPRGSTPLIDAAYKTIKAVEASLNGEIGTKVVICIQTDGHENCSTEFTWDELQALIKEKTALGWEFLFMGASIDAYDQGAKMGISVAHTMSYNGQDSVATRAAFAASASNTSMFASGFRASTAYSSMQKLASGDAFDPDLNKTRPPLKQGPQKVMSKPKPPIVDEFKL